MFGYDNVRSQVIALSDLGADGTVPIWKTPTRATKVEILEASVVLSDAIAGVGTAIYLKLLDMGAAGTLLAGTVSAVLGATGTGDWTARVPRNFTISEGTLDGGDWLAVDYEETGTVAWDNMILTVSWVSGVGA